MDTYAATAFESAPGIDPAFAGVFISGYRFSSAEEAEAYGRKTFGENFADVKVFHSEDNLPF